jgi:protein-disulfide isomerase
MKNPWLIVGLITVALIGGLWWYGNVSAARNNEGVEINTVHRKGPENARVQLVEYSDFQCPACASFQPVVADVLEQFGDQISFEYRHFPLTALHPYAEPAARAAEAAGQQGQFFAYHDKLFAEQASWSKSNPTGAFLRYADELGLDVEKFSRHLRSSLLREKVRADAASGREKQLVGTPSFFLNGQLMEFDTFQEFFDQIATAVDPSYAVETGTGTTTPTTGLTPATPTVRFGI